MNIKIKEEQGGNGWTLWVTDEPGDDQPPTHAAYKRTPEQILALLPVILGQASERPPPPAMASKARSQALWTVLNVLDGWIEGARENHQASGHRLESGGEECWRQFTPADIRRMINDAARELGIKDFPEPMIAKEDEK